MMERKIPIQPKATEHATATATSPNRVHKSKKAIAQKAFNTPEREDRMIEEPAVHKTTWDIYKEEANKEEEEREQFQAANLTFQSWQAEMDIEAGLNPSSPENKNKTSSRTKRGPAEVEYQPRGNRRS